MSKHRYAAKIDSNQNDIICKLKKIPGLTVARKHDDILVGLVGFTFWYEIKSENALKKDGSLKKNALKKSQEAIKKSFSGHYAIVRSYEDILIDMIAFFEHLKEVNYISGRLKMFLDEAKEQTPEPAALNYGNLINGSATR